MKWLTGRWHHLLRWIRDEWDRFLIYLMLMLYGAYSLAYPIISFERAAPYWAEIALGVEFFAAGILLIAGINKPRFRMAGLWVVAVGLSTISLTVAVVGGARVLAYAFLFGAFAMQSVHDIRQERLQEQRRRLEAERLAKEVIHLAEEARQGVT